MGACCTTTPQEHTTNTQKPLIETQPVPASNVTPSQDNETQNNTNIKSTSHEQKKNIHTVSLEERIEAGHSKFDKDNIEETKLTNNDTNVSLIQTLISNPQINKSINNKSISKNDALYDMISSERLRYAIRDLIEKHNKIYDINDIVADFEIRKILQKWKYNLLNLYLKLLTEYNINISDIDSLEYTKNTEIYRLSNEYEMSKKLGRGSYAIVKKTKRLSDSKYFAAKIINKRGLSKYDLRGLRLEIAIMRDLEHSNVVRLYDVFESRIKICLIIELLSGGELLDVVIEKQSFSEHEASQCFAQLCDALQYLHSKRIAHRDLKPDNLLFSYKISNWNAIPKDCLKLVDFGLAERVRRDRGLKEYCGTPIYMAPEIFDQQEYDYSVDMWSSGCILYALLVGYPPFDFDEDHDINELSRMIRNDKVDFDMEYWSGISNDSKDLIKKLLAKNPKQRFTAKQSLNHKWMQNASKQLFDQKRMDRLRKFKSVNKLKRGVTAMIAVIRLTEVFEDIKIQMDKKEKQEEEQQQPPPQQQEQEQQEQQQQQELEVS